MVQEQPVDDGKRYRIRIDDVSYYVILTDVSISVSYAFENREENIKTRTVLEKFCTGLSKIMQEKDNVQKALGNVVAIGTDTGVESQVGVAKEVCG